MIARTLKPFFTRRTIKMLTDKAKDTCYYFDIFPGFTACKNYGIYLHIPFCKSHCNFCPYYKCLYSREKADLFVKAITLEIKQSTISGNPRWLYIGGGTPNTLKAEELDRIISALKAKVKLGSIGIELTPAPITSAYLTDLKKTGVTKISLGVETFSSVLLDKENRSAADEDQIRMIVDTCHTLGILVSFDIMLGFNDQKIYTFRKDMATLAKILPDQVTIYPLMTIRGTKLNRQTIDDHIIFSLVEESGKMLKTYGYKRKTLWSFCRKTDLYDSSYDELGTRYIGFGPSAISSTREWVSVNLPLDAYIKNMESENVKRVFLNRHVKTGSHESWRQFGMMLYSCELKFRNYFPFYLNFLIGILKLAGFSAGARLSQKGLLYAHDLTKAIVETKSFPLQYPGCIVNRDVYEQYASSQYADNCYVNSAGGAP